MSEEERIVSEICDRLDKAVFGEHGSGTRWINGSQRLDYLIAQARDQRHAVLYLQRSLKIVEQSWKESLETFRNEATVVNEVRGR